MLRWDRNWNIALHCIEKLKQEITRGNSWGINWNKIRSNTNYASLWLSRNEYSSNGGNPICNITSMIIDYVENGRDLTELLTENIKALFIGSWMSETNRVWIPSIYGDQDRDDKPHRVLINAITKVLDDEKADK